MMFDRYPRYEGFRDTPRKRSAVLRKQRSERESLPLFADQVAALQPSVDEVMAKRSSLADTVEMERRKFVAKWWRVARASFYGLPSDQKAKVITRWRRWWGPRNSSCLLYLCAQAKAEQL
ncbi:MAG: hypothetical protein WAX67_12510 [Rugosibacter sp.]|jgi:hypothetical protein